MDVIYIRFYFGEVQEEVLGQSTGQDISAPRTEGLSVCQWSVPEKKKERKCLYKYFTDISRFVLEIFGKLKGHSKCASIKVCYTP